MTKSNLPGPKAMALIERDCSGLNWIFTSESCKGDSGTGRKIHSHLIGFLSRELDQTRREVG